MIKTAKGNNRSIAIGYVKALFLFLTEAFETSTTGRVSAATGAAIATAASILAMVLLKKPFSTTPVELMGCFAYYWDLNITNRLVGVTLCILVALLTFVVFTSFLFYIKEEKKSQQIIGYCLLPALFWLASIAFHYQKEIETFWLYFSAGMCWLALFAIFRERNKMAFENVMLFLVSSGFSFFVAPALVVFLKSSIFWKLTSYCVDPGKIQEIISVLGRWLANNELLFPLSVFLFWLIFPKRYALARFVFYPTQLLLLLFYFLVLPGFFRVDGNLTQFFRNDFAFYVIVLPLFIAGAWDCTRRCFFNKRSLFSPFPFLSLLFFVFLRKSPVPGFTGNLFEFGARLPGFWMSFDGCNTLFKDVYITYGLWDYVQFLFAWLFSGQHTAAASTYGLHLFNAFIITIEFLTVSNILPVSLAFLVCLIAGVGPQSVVLLYIAILIHPRLVGRPAAWISAWIILSAIAPFARIPQGAICVVASIPALIWQMLKLVEQDKQTFWKIVGFLTATGFLMLIWPFGDYFWGLLRIFIETAKVNSASAANLWKINDMPLIQVLLGNSVLILPLISLISVIIILKIGNSPFKYFIAIFICSFVILYSFASISYGFSRTDNLPFQRQYHVLAAAMLPLIVGIMSHIRQKTVLNGCICILLGLFAVRPYPLSNAVHYPYIRANPMEFLRTESDYPTLSGKDIDNAKSYGLPQLGTGKFPAKYLKEDSALKKALDNILSPDETFLDLTMVGLHYFSSQRKLITEYPAYYLYPGIESQLRAVEKLKKHNVNVTLLESNYLDYSPSPLRAYYLYRYALLRGLPLEITPTKTILMPKQYFEKKGLNSPDLAQTLRLLDKRFPFTNYSEIPFVWGRGYNKFVENIKLVRTLKTDSVRMHNKGICIDFTFLKPIKGTDAGLLAFKVNKPVARNDKIEIRWVDGSLPEEENKIYFKAHDGMNIVPLDASPRWLLARDIRRLTVQVVSVQIHQYERKKAWEMKKSLPAIPLTVNRKMNYRPKLENMVFVKNDDPIMICGIPDKLEGENLLVRAVIIVPIVDGDVTIFYRAPNLFYYEGNSEKVPVHVGINEIYFILPKDMSIDELRLNPGCSEEIYTIKALEAKILTSNNFPIKISGASLFQRPYVDQK